jgi:hypothetical protein
MTIFTSGYMLIKAWAIFSATGWTVVEPASVISPESPPEAGGVAGVAGLVGVVGAAGEEGVEGVDGVVVEGVLGAGVVGVVGVSVVQPARIIAAAISRTSGNISHLDFFIYFLSFFLK